MTKTEIARRILNVCSGPVRPRKVETKLAKCQLRDEDDGLWSIVLDPRFLDQNMIDRLLLPADAWPPSDVMPTTK